MSRKCKKRVVEYEVVFERTCDICGYLCHDKDNWNEGTQGWDGIEYVQTGLYLQHSDETSKFELVVDICPLCFVKKLVPWMKSQGADVPDIPANILYN